MPRGMEGTGNGDSSLRERKRKREPMRGGESRGEESRGGNKEVEDSYWDTDSEEAGRLLSSVVSFGPVFLLWETHQAEETFDTTDPPHDFKIP